MRNLSPAEILAADEAYMAAANVLKSKDCDPDCMLTVAAIIAGSVAAVTPGGLEVTLAEVCRIARHVDTLRLRSRFGE